LLEHKGNRVLGEDVPLVLEGRFVRLEPIRGEHAALFWEVAKDDAEEIFRWFPWSMRSIEDSRSCIDLLLKEENAGRSVAFATTLRDSGQIVGSTRFLNIDVPNRHAEIGTTWIVPAWQRTAVNTEAKYLMLRHAFEQWCLLRVEFKTDALNEKSRAALRRLGAKEEGILRKHVVTWTGRVRDSVYFSILDTEWPAVKTALEASLSRSRRDINPL
jgi:RimJ/RimL family protein N-acetyltransferase